MKSQSDNLALAQRYKDAGQLDLAMRTCQQVVSFEPRNAAALHLLGVTLHLQGKQQEAIDKLKLAVGIEPSSASFLITLGGNLAIAGDIAEATRCFRNAVSAAPTSAEAHHNLGLALKHQSMFPEAETCFRAAVQLAPGYIDAIANLGYTLVSQNKPVEAKAAFAHALTLSPTHALSLTHLARICVAEGDRAGAETLLQALDPNASEAALLHLATTYAYLADNRLAVSALRHMVSKFPKSAEAHAVLAIGLMNNFEIADAIASAETAISLNQECAGAWHALGLAHAYAGRVTEAKAALTKTLALRPLLGPRVLRDLMLPCIMGTREEVAASRVQFEENLDALMAQGLTSASPFTEIGFTYFYLAFHGQNDIHLQKKIASFYEQVSPTLLYEAPHCREAVAARATRKKRLGFYSKFISTHSVSFSFSKILEAIEKTGQFDIYLISDSPVDSETVRDMYPTLAGRAVQVPRDLPAAIAKIAPLELDILVYLDIGMDPLSFLLAFARLAPIQCVMGGHPVTTGIRNIDYFLSGQWIEPNDAQHHYTEQLVLLQHGGFMCQRMTMPDTIKTRAQLGMPAQRRIYLCPMTLQKIHPDFDDALEKILALDRDGAVVFFESPQSPAWTPLLSARFDRTIQPALRNRIVFMPWIVNQQDLIRIIEASDVVLDPFHFGIGTTGIHIFSAGTPIVTRPSRFLRGRVGFFYCRLLETMQCVTTTVDEYVERAVQIATDPILRDGLRQTILKNNHRLFENDEAGPELARVLGDLTTTTCKAAH